MTGAWTLTDEGTFELNEPYKSLLLEIKHIGSVAFQEAMFKTLSDRTGLDQQFLEEEFVKKCTNAATPIDNAVDEFIVQVLEGTL